MRIIVLIALALTMVCESPRARFMHLWTYEELVQEADCILILSVDSASERTGQQTNSLQQRYDLVRTRFKVHAVLKGEYHEKTLDYQSLAYPKDLVPINLFDLAWFDRQREFYMAFLKRTSDGTFEAVTGEVGDSQYSFYKLPNDRMTETMSVFRSNGQTNGPPTNAPTVIPGEVQKASTPR